MVFLFIIITKNPSLAQLPAGAKEMANDGWRQQIKLLLVNDFLNFNIKGINNFFIIL
jgi:hypothetical protein